MRRRRKTEDEHDNPERWMVSYADFITLLFAFFVVMYSVASINQGQYRVLSDSIVSAFRPHSVTPGGQYVELPPVIFTTPLPFPVTEPAEEAESNQPATPSGDGQLRRVRDIADEIRDVLGPLVREGQVMVSDGDQGITVEINAAILFAPGEAALGAGAIAPMRAVANVLAAASFPVVVEGHTDNLPISTPRFPSNWELSAARAASVVRLFITSGVNGTRLTAAGYADQRPVADNSTPEGRARNRRVTLYIESRFIEPDDDSPQQTDGMSAGE